MMPQNENKAPHPSSGNAIPPPKPFPYWPPQPSEEQLKRTELMMELDKWANNDPFMAKRAAETLIMLLANQFNITIASLKYENTTP